MHRGFGDVCAMAGLLTSLSLPARLPGDCQWLLVPANKDNSQQRDCSGLSPDSLLITKE